MYTVMSDAKSATTARTINVLCDRVGPRPKVFVICSYPFLTGQAGLTTGSTRPR